MSACSKLNILRATRAELVVFRRDFAREHVLKYRNSDSSLYITTYLPIAQYPYAVMPFFS